MKHKHTFRYKCTGFNDDDFPDAEVRFEIDGDSTLTGMLSMFETYLLGCGYSFDGHVNIVNHSQDPQIISTVNYPQPDPQPQQESFPIKAFRSKD